MKYQMERYADTYGTFVVNRICAIVPGEKQRKRASWEAQDLFWGIILKTKKEFWLGTEPSTKNNLTDSESNQRWF